MSLANVSGSSAAVKLTKIGCICSGDEGGDHFNEPWRSDWLSSRPRLWPPLDTNKVAAMLGCGRQWYPILPAVLIVVFQESPGAMSPESKVPSSAVAV
jgi:hypothetical protein